MGTMESLDSFQDQIGLRFRNPNLLALALTHPSMAHEQGAQFQHNQRLEFLGDSVLQLILSRELYVRFPNVGEGPLTKARAQMVNRRSLAEQARRLQIGEYLTLSRGEEVSGGRQRASALADAFEALVGAIFLDGGFETAQAFVLKHFHDHFGGLAVIPNLENPKGELQELLQARSAESPQYQIAAVRGPEHDREFECTVHYGGKEIGRGIGKNKKEAESEAALAALKGLRAEPIDDPSA
jgi:ribonuclease-3